MAAVLNASIIQFQVLEIMIVLFCGLIFGSFASALTYRVPRGLPWVTKGKSEHGLRSACPSCKALLTPRDLIPLLSWAMTKGKCRHCSAPVPKTYPICELLSFLGCLGVYAIFGLTWLSILMLIMIPFLVALMMIDFEHMILPNQLVAIIFLLGLLTLVLEVIGAPNHIAALLITYTGGAVLFGLFAWGLGILMEKILKKEALGFGDVKFFAAVGVWIGVPAIGYFCLGAGLIGVALGLVWKKATGEPTFPFGPALILSFYTVLLLQGSHFL